MSWNASSLRQLSPEARLRFISSLTDDEACYLLHDWPVWARPDQLTPEGDWLTWLAMAGRGWGKTRVGSQTTIAEVQAGRAARIALVAETAADVRDVMVEGDSGIMKCSPPWFRPTYEPSKRKLTWPNGALAYTYNATEPDQLRGPQFDFAWSDELAKWQYGQETWDNLQFGLRLGTRPRQLVTTTPRPIPLIRELLRDPTVHVTRGRTLDNADNLAPSFMKKILRRYEGTRLGRQELNAEILDDVPGALWSREMIDLALVVPPEPPTMRRVVVAVDPSGTAGEDDDGDSIGIVVAGRSDEGQCYIMADRTCKLSPAGWGRVVADAYAEFGADRVVAEANFGGAMVESVIRSVNPRIAYRAVKASRGKAVRAEPVAALYEQKRVVHLRSMTALEDQMCHMTPEGYMGDGSPDRLDAMVWAVTELMLTDGSTYTLDNV